jgi:kumamolisin
MGPADPHERMSVTIVVRRRLDAPPLPDLESWQKTPSGSHPFVSRDAFAASYGAAEEDLQRVAAFARSKGLTVEETSIARRTVLVSGTVAQFNDGFSVELGRYESPDQTYRGREGSIHVPAELAGIIEGVFGLDNRRIGGRNSGPGSLNAGELTPPRVASLYNFPTGTATGQTIGILMMENGYGYRSSDLEAFFHSLGAGFTTPTIHEINIGTASNTPGGGCMNWL